MIYRLFKLPANVDRSNSQVVYNGTVTENENELKVGTLDISFVYRCAKATVSDMALGNVFFLLRMRFALITPGFPLIAIIVAE